jgi:hypothetical protein
MTYRKRKRTKTDGLGPILDGDFLDVDMMFQDTALRDELQRRYPTNSINAHDGSGNVAGFKKGFVYGDEASREVAHAAYQERSKHLNDAWRKDGKTTDDGERPSNLKDAQDAAALAYEERNERLRNGWREKTP